MVKTFILFNVVHAVIIITFKAEDLCLEVRYEVRLD